jgi:hypothetical protein
LPLWQEVGFSTQRKRPTVGMSESSYSLVGVSGSMWMKFGYGWVEEWWHAMTSSTENLAATISFRLTDEECRALALRAGVEQRTLSQLIRMLLRTVMQSADLT